MKLMSVFALCLLIGITYGADDVSEKPKTTTTHGPPTTHAPTATPTTTEATTTTSTSRPSTSTAAPTTTSTAAPTTTSTAAPTTPSPTPSPPTPAPTTPSPSPAPITTAKPPTEWVVVDPSTNIACILAKMEVTFTYHMGTDTKTMNMSPATAEGSGSCGNVSQTLSIRWGPQPDELSSMTLIFAKNKNNYYVSKLQIALSLNSSKGFETSEFSAVNVTLIESNVNTSYSCESVELPQMNNSNNETLNVKIGGLLIEAFRHDTKASFSTTHYCSGEVPDIVPLVVGIALAALVLVVVIAYLIGRRRSQARGYLSM